MSDINKNINDIDTQNQSEVSLIDVQDIEKIRLILDINAESIEEYSHIEFESSCPKISEDIPEEFFYDDSKDIIEVEFKGSRRAYFYKEEDLHLTMSDYVIVEAEKGVDLGRVCLLGELVHIKRKAQVLRKDILRKIISKASSEDTQKMTENREIEENAFLVCRKKIDEHGLPMKLIDVEYQFDRNRVTFYFTSDKRIDFRELVKDLAAEYRTRIELRQIGVRDEAKMIGGISGCGRVLCCCTFLNDFKRITTQVAKTQMLNMNPVKLSGQCGRLKCCLMYEHDYYCQELKSFPALESIIKTPKGDGMVEKVDIFKKMVYLHYMHDDSWETFSLEDFQNMINGVKPENAKSESQLPKDQFGTINLNSREHSQNISRDQNQRKEQRESKEQVNPKNQQDQNSTKDHSIRREQGNRRDQNQGNKDQNAQREQNQRRDHRPKEQNERREQNNQNIQKDPNQRKDQGGQRDQNQRKEHYNPKGQNQRPNKGNQNNQNIRREQNNQKMNPSQGINNTESNSPTENSNIKESSNLNENNKTNNTN